MIAQVMFGVFYYLLFVCFVCFSVVIIGAFPMFAIICCATTRLFSLYILKLFWGGDMLEYVFVLW